MTLPLAVVGASWRTSPTRLRAALSAVDQGEDSPSQALMASGVAQGIVKIETCSRTEWVVSATDPAWAAELLRSALVSRLGADPRPLHLRVGPGAARYLFRVACGLDAVAQGEGAVGHQALKAFEAARAAGTTDRVLHLAFQALSPVLQARRSALGASGGPGVQALVAQALHEAGVKGAVPILGTGSIGTAVARSLPRQPHLEALLFARADLAGLLAAAATAPAVVVATGGPQAWVDLPERPPGPTPLAIDVGSPAQIRSAPGWKIVGLDELLVDRGGNLDDDVLLGLEAACDDAVVGLHRALDRAREADTLSALDQVRKTFLRERLPGLLEGLPKDRARRLEAELAAFAHQVLLAVREEST